MAHGRRDTHTQALPVLSELGTSQANAGRSACVGARLCAATGRCSHPKTQAIGTVQGTFARTRCQPPVAERESAIRYTRSNHTGTDHRRAAPRWGIGHPAYWQLDDIHTKPGPHSRGWTEHPERSDRRGTRLTTDRTAPPRIGKEESCTFRLTDRHTDRLLPMDRRGHAAP